ncbi:MULTISPECIES: LD-carboxypeptidase [unclassified Bacillus (in: firmicutes)]|uniref:S66 peptidase family protein n=1 Tax=unclassified Bacillus (in: firmicutes) TaxID=185979 RepID=UPI001BE531AB|nr:MULTISPECIES: LD-carboxypeptidase [unclassified Bacillus (in: firmicutes)]MBT2639591.1 LD-carboxypeptidase [Bacillus sp. ISL-39]MBT2661269.1 LD-carboxypeptidase [Bacillus sp. ISL-45]
MPIKPERLRKGDTVAVIAPASPPNKENLKRGLKFVEDLGLNYKLGKSLYTEYGYLAGNDEERLGDLQEMFLDKEIKGIICAGGGYGTARIASAIDYDAIKNNPKIFWGYSDITFLHTAIRQQTGMVTFHGPMLASDIGKEEADQISKETFQQLFIPADLNYSSAISHLEELVPGSAEGSLVGGNLSLLSSSMGTPFEIDTEGRILLIEDINEEPRAVDRMLNQLYMAGKLQGSSGILIGDFNNCVPERELSLSLDEVIEHYIKLAGRPALKGFNMGHCSPHIGVPLGANASMNTKEKTLFVESGIK